VHARRSGSGSGCVVKVLEEMSSSLDSGPNATAAEAEMDAWAAPSQMPAKTLSGLAPPAGSDDLRV
jgi:hypothetical protein